MVMAEQHGDGAETQTPNVEQDADPAEMQNNMNSHPLYPIYHLHPRKNTFCVFPCFPCEIDMQRGFVSGIANPRTKQIGNLCYQSKPHTRQIAKSV